MTAEKPEKSPEPSEDPCFDQGRDKRMRPEDVEPGKEYLVRFRNRSTGDVFEMSVTVLKPLEAGPDCDRLWVNIHCDSYDQKGNKFDREKDFQFDKESGCLIQFCGGEQQEIGYIVRTVKDPEEALAAFSEGTSPSV